VSQFSDELLFINCFFCVTRTKALIKTKTKKRAVYFLIRLHWALEKNGLLRQFSINRYGESFPMVVAEHRSFFQDTKICTVPVLFPHPNQSTPLNENPLTTKYQFGKSTNKMHRKSAWAENPTTTVLIYCSWWDFLERALRSWLIFGKSTSQLVDF